MHDLGTPRGPTGAMPAPPPPAPPEPSRARLVRWFDSWMRSLGMALVLFLVVRTFLLEAFQIPSGSMERTLLAGLGLLVAGALLNVLGQLKFRWAIPIFFLLPLYLCWRLEQLGLDAPRRRRLRIYGWVLVGTEALMVAGILVQTYAGARLAAPARLNTPYDAVADAVAASGFRRGTIVAGVGPLGGNLRLAFPDARVTSLETPGYLPPRAGGADGGDCLLAWDGAGDSAVPAYLGAWLRERLAVEDAAPVEIGSVTMPHRHAPALLYRAFFVRLSPGVGRCR